MAGLSTCLVIHTQDPTAEFLLGCKIGSSAIVCNNNLSALRFETTKVCFFDFLFLIFLGQFRFAKLGSSNCKLWLISFNISDAS